MKILHIVTSVEQLHALSSRGIKSCTTTKLLTLGASKYWTVSTQAKVVCYVSPPSSDSEHAAWLHAYRDIMDALAAYNGDQLIWWSTHIASKNRFTSPLALLLPQLRQCVNAINALQASGAEWQELIIAGLDRPMIQLLASFTDDTLAVHVHGKLFGRLSSLRRKAKLVYSLLTEVKNCIKRIWQVRCIFGKAQACDTTPTYLIKTFAYVSSFSVAKVFNDPFFPELAKKSHQYLPSGTRLLRLAYCPEQPKTVWKAMRLCNDVFPVECYQSFFDPLRVFLPLAKCILFPSFRVPPLPFLGRDVAPLLRALWAYEGVSAPIEQALYYTMGRRLAQRYNLCGCLLTYEGNPWERMLVAGLRVECLDIPITGCQHAASPPASVGILPGPVEHRTAPLPDKIVTTGQGMTAFITSHSAWTAEEVVTGGSLRQHQLHRLPRLPLPQHRTLVLVFLESTYDTSELLQYALNQALNLPHIMFRLRAHPVLPLPKILHSMKIESLPDNVEISTQSLVADIAEASVALYWGSTTAAEALVMGRPIIRCILRDEALCYDLLHGLDTCKQSVYSSHSLAGALATIASTPAAQLSQELSKARGFVYHLFSPVSDATLKHFFRITPRCRTTDTPYQADGARNG